MAKGKYEYWLTPEGLLKLEAWARNGLTDEQIASNMGINVATLYRYKDKYCDICEALKRGKEIIDIQVENALLKRALGYEYEEVTRERIVDTGQNKRHGGESELTEKEWEFSKKYFNGKCCYCGIYTEDLTKDHVKPLKEGGKLTFNNVIPACRSCNSSKKDNEIMSWYQSTDFYDKNKLRKIFEYMDFVNSLGGKLDQSKEDNYLVVTKVVTKQVIPDTTAQIFWLKNRRPDLWRDKQQIEHSGHINNPFEGISTEDIKKALGKK